MIVHEVEQGTPEWLDLRAGLPTASEFSKLITPTGKPSTQYATWAFALAAEKYAGGSIDQWQGNGITDRGHEFEIEARAYYEFITDRKATQVGFVTDDAISAGCSPDSFVGDDGLLEIKCALAPKHTQSLAHIRAEGTCPPDYMPQVQGQLFICQRAWCDLLFFHPQLPPIIVRVEPDKEVQKILMEGIEKTNIERDRILAALKTQEKEAA